MNHEKQRKSPLHLSIGRYVTGDGGPRCDTQLTVCHEEASGSQD